MKESQTVPPMEEGELSAAEWLALPETSAWWAQQMARNQAAIALLQSFLEEDEEGAQEQHETFAYLKRALDEDRLSARKLFL